MIRDELLLEGEASHTPAVLATGSDASTEQPCRTETCLVV